MWKSKKGVAKIPIAGLIVAIVGVVVTIVFYVTDQNGEEPGAEILFDQVPTAGVGGDPTEEISGKVVGIDHPEEYKIVIYAYTDYWYVQPLEAKPLTDIGRDGAWSNNIHFGDKYAAILVSQKYEPAAKITALPVIDGNVLAKAIKHGKETGQ